MFKLDSRVVLGASVALAAALGCSTQVTVFDPPPSPTGPTGPVTPQTSQFNGATRQAPTAPPPISGGTLLTLVTPDGNPIAVAADPEEDVIDVVSLGASPALLGTVSLQTGDQPGRMVADAAGRVHVVLRGGGGIATLASTSSGWVVASRRSVCSAPRGIDYSAKNDSLYVACATGELVVLPAAGGGATAMADLGRDLRDVVATDSAIYVSRFRSANVLVVDPTTLGLTSTLAAPNETNAQPDVLWRLTREPNGMLRVVYQLASTTPIDVATPPGESSYGDPTNTFNGPSGGVVSVESAEINTANNTFETPEPLLSNPVVDIAVGPDSQWEAVSVLGDIETTGQSVSSIGQNVQDAINNPAPDTYVAIADARGAANAVVLQRRGQNPALVVVHVDTSRNVSDVVTVALPQKTSHVDTGFDIFTIPTAAGVACMNCHPEGGDDGHVWRFQMSANSTDSSTVRIRRTQSLRGGVIASSAPYHWDGDMANMKMLCDEVFTHRMGGGDVASTQELILTRFLDSMPRVPVKANLDPVRIAAGKSIFEGSGGCTACHVGGTGTLPVNQDVGKTDINGDTPLQVPMLVGIADRAPYMHDGCASTLMERLEVNECAGTKHGNVAQLSSDDKTNLIEFLQSL